MHTVIKGCSSPWPDLPYGHWSETVKTLHMWTQIVGKVRLRAMPWQNHSWHTTLYVSPKGFTTGSMPYENGIFEIEFDFVSHCLIIKSTFNEPKSFELEGLSVAEFYNRLFETLEEIGVRISIHSFPNEVEEAPHFTEMNFGEYSVQHILNFWQAAVSIHNVFQKFRSEFIGKCSPVHLFWGAFDIALTRFSGRPAPEHQGSMPNMPAEVMKEAYSQEVSSCGFWPGAESFPEPIFYSYCYPTPQDFSKSKVKPREAFWIEELGEFALKYDDVRQAEDPEKMLMEFLQSTYEAAAITGGWNRDFLEK